MKKSIKIASVCAIVVGIALLAGSLAFAAAGGRSGFLPAMAMQRITRYLNLTSDQQTQARAIFKAAFLQAKGVLTPAQLTQVKTLRGQGCHAKAALNLTADQRAQMKTIREQAKTTAQAIEANTTFSAADKQTQLQALRQSTRQQMQRVLTPAQQQQMKDARANRMSGLRSLNLTADQKTQLKSIRDTALAQLRAILTPAQQTKFDAFIAEHPAITR